MFGIGVVGLMFLEMAYEPESLNRNRTNFETHGRKLAPIGAMMTPFPMLTSPATGQQSRDQIRSQLANCGGSPTVDG